MKVDIAFHGGLATRHKLPALEACQSLEGVTRTLTLISHYAVSGKVRHKQPFSEEFKLELLGFERGSFLTKLGLTLSAGAVAAALGSFGIDLAKGAAGNFAYDLIKHVYSETVGTPKKADDPAIRALLDARGGDIDALREAIVPSAKRSHTVVGNGANSITVIGDGNNITVLNQSTKSYLDEVDTSDLPEVKVVSVGMFNVNGRNGRVYDFEHQKNISFLVRKDASPQTMAKLAQSLSAYARSREKSEVYIKYYVLLDAAGRPIRYYIIDAWFEGER